MSVRHYTECGNPEFTGPAADAAVGFVRVPWVRPPHYDGCWEHYGHHGCAIAEIERLRALIGQTILFPADAPRETVET